MGWRHGRDGSLETNLEQIGDGAWGDGVSARWVWGDRVSGRRSKEEMREIEKKKMKRKKEERRQAGEREKERKEKLFF